jgi:hypothetical protein
MTEPNVKVILLQVLSIDRVHGGHFHLLEQPLDYRQGLGHAGNKHNPAVQLLQGLFSGSSTRKRATFSG